MPSPILVTKLFIPAARPEIVSRPRLIERICDGLHRNLTLISAPAGFGKTTLVTEWLTHLQGNAHQDEAIKNKITWFSLDEGDNDPARFLTYFIAALNQIKEIDFTFGEGSLMMLQSPQPPPIDAILTPLINEIASSTGVAVSDRIIFVLDDYHLIDSQPIQDILGFILENLPPQLHLVITTREDPLLPLPRLRAREQLTELRAADLRFTSTETAEFLNQVMGLNLSIEDITALETRTEGWIAGLQLASLSLQGQPDTSKLIQSFTGSNRLVLDYLIEEVLSQQPENIQNFLLQTAILNRLIASLCDAVCFGCKETLTEQENGQTILEKLERANLFIISLDDQRRWYRYHHLFAELLQQRLKATHPDWIPELHAKAVNWYDENDYLSEAIHHAFAGNDINTAARLIEKGALTALERSDFSFILNSVAQLPESALENAPWLFVYHTWALILMGYVDLVSPRLENTNWLLDSVSDDSDQKRKMIGYIAGLKEHLAGWRRDYSKIIDFSTQAAENLPQNHWIRGYCAMGMGTVFWGNGNLIAAKETFTEAASIAKASGNKRVAVASAIYLGHSLELEGQLQKSAAYFQDSFQLSMQDGRELPLAGYLHIDLARILYELNELERTSQHLETGIQQCQWLSEKRVEKLGHRILSLVYLAQGKVTSAFNSIQIGEQTHPSTEPAVDMRGTEYIHIRFFLRQNKLKKVAAWLEEQDLNLDNVSHFKTKMTYTMHARALIAMARTYPDEQHLDDALVLLEQLLEMTERNGWGKKVIEILVLQSLALDLAGKKESALKTLEYALNRAELEGYVRTFVDEGPPMAGLLYEALSYGIAPDYVRRLLAAFPEIEPEPTIPSRTQSPNDEWIEPLTERELDILNLIAEGLINREIGDKLYLSVNTVKAHTRNIYGKLRVNNRTQAVNKAKSLGILSER